MLIYGLQQIDGDVKILPLQGGSDRYLGADNTGKLKIMATPALTDTVPTGMTFSTVNGDLVLTLSNGATVTRNLDGRYSLFSHNHTLDSLSNVNTSGLTSGKGLSWNGTQWVPTSFAVATGSTDYIQNQTGVAQNASFNISGTGTMTGLLTLKGQAGFGTTTYNGLDDAALSIEHASGGSSSIYFRSGVNYPSDFGYIRFRDTYSGSGESNELVIGVENDGTADRLHLKSYTIINNHSASSQNPSRIVTFQTASVDKAYIDVSGNFIGSGATLSAIPALGTAASSFLVSNGGVISSRTASQLLSDLGVDLTALKSDTHTTTTTTNNLAVGWYTIAVNAGSKAIARFAIRDVTSSRHNTVVFYASHMYGADNANDITVLHYARYQTPAFSQLRIKEGGTFEGAMLQVYVSDTGNTLNAYILGDQVDAGWSLRNWVPDGTDPGGTGVYANLTNIATVVDLSKVYDGGIITTGEIYAGGQTTQNKVWHVGNDGVGSGLDADLLDGQQGSYYAPATGGTYVSKAGDTMTDRLQHAVGSIKGIGFGSTSQTNIDSVDGNQLVIRTDSVRLGTTGASWNYDNWAGLKYVDSAKTLYIGGARADSSIWQNNGGNANDTYIKLIGLINSNGLQVNGNAVWHAGNDGLGSGLDADLLDGQQGSYYAPTTHKYHTFSNGQYYYDSYAQGNYLRIFTQNSVYDNIRFQPYSNVEYYNYTTSTWQAWTGSDATIQALLDGREETQVGIDHTHRTFRFTVTRNSGWGLTTLIVFQSNWTAITFTPVTMTVETHNGTSFVVKDTCVFNATNTAGDHGTHMKVSTNLHDGYATTRITVDITDWTDNTTYTTIPVKALMLLSNYSGNADSIEPWTWDYSKMLKLTSLSLNTIANATTNTDKFLVSDAGVVKYRTAAQLLSDLGSAPSSGSGNYIQNQSGSTQTADFKISGNGSVGGTLNANSYLINGSTALSYTGTSLLRINDGSFTSVSITAGNLLVGYTGAATEKLYVNGTGRFTGALQLDSVVNETVDPDKILVSSSGVVKYMTKTQLGIGSVAQPNTQVVYGTGTGTTSNSNFVWNGSQIVVNNVAASSGGIKITGPAADNNLAGGIEFSSANGTTITSKILSSVNGLQFFSTSTEGMRLTTSGNLLVGTTTDTTGYKLQVNGLAMIGLPPVANMFFGGRDLMITSSVNAANTYTGIHIQNTNTGSSAASALSFGSGTGATSYSKILFDNTSQMMTVMGGAGTGTQLRLAPNWSANVDIYSPYLGRALATFNGTSGNALINTTTDTAGYNLQLNGKAHIRNADTPTKSIIIDGTNGVIAVDGTTSTDIPVNITRASTGTNNFIRMYDTATTGYLTLGGGSSSGFYPLLTMKPDGSTWRTGSIQVITTDAAVNSAALRLDSRLSGGPLVSTPVMEVGSYGDTYMQVRAGGNVLIGTTTNGTNRLQVEKSSGYGSNIGSTTYSKLAISAPAGGNITNAYAATNYMSVAATTAAVSGQGVAASLNTLYLDHVNYSYTTNNEWSAQSNNLFVYYSTANRIANTRLYTEYQWGSNISVLMDLYISNPTSTTTGNTIGTYYPIFQEGSTGKNYFASKILQGTTTDNSAYHSLQTNGGIYQYKVVTGSNIAAYGAGSSSGVQNNYTINGNPTFNYNFAQDNLLYLNGAAAAQGYRSGGLRNNLYLNNSQYSHTGGHTWAATTNQVDMTGGSTATALINTAMVTNIDAASSITTYYDLYIQGVTGAGEPRVTTHWGVYSESASAKNYFGGNLLVGTTTTTFTGRTVLATSTGNFAGGFGDNLVLTGNVSPAMQWYNSLGPNGYQVGLTSGNLVFSALTNQTTKTDQLTLTSDGKLLLGFSSSQGSFGAQLKGNLFIHDGGSGTVTSDYYTSTSGLIGNIFGVGGGGGGFFVRANTGFNLYLGTLSGGYSIGAYTNGNVGIGSSSAPTYKFEVVGTTHFTGNSIFDTLAGTGVRAVVTDATGTLSAQAGGLANVQYNTYSATQTLTDSQAFVEVSAASGVVTINLPTAVGRTGKVFEIIKTDSTTNEVTITANGTELINGSNTFSLTVQYEAVGIISNGTKWLVRP